MTNAPIRGFRGPYRFLSNFYPSLIKMDGYTYPTAEHAYQASKTSEALKHYRIRNAPTPATARDLGKQIPLPSNWMSTRIGVMRRIVRLKFEQHPNLREKLIRTGQRALIEQNNWGDEFWGVCQGKGQNELGKILMELRHKFQFDDAVSGTNTYFDGDTYDPAQDKVRLCKQRMEIYNLVADRRWWTLAGISQRLGHPEASVSAALRDFRKKRFGSHTVSKRRVQTGGGLWEYKLENPVPPEMREIRTRTRKKEQEKKEVVSYEVRARSTSWKTQFP